MNKQPTFSKLYNLLNTLGFLKQEYPNSHIIFKQPEQNQPLIILPYTSPRKSVTPSHLLAVKRTLIDNHIINEQDFMKMLFS